jgi:hypothetical protein
MVHRDDAVERGVQGRAVTLLDGVPGILGAAAFDQLAELEAEQFERAQEFMVRLLRATSEELEHADQTPLADDRKARRGVQSGRARLFVTGQCLLGGKVRDP